MLDLNLNFIHEDGRAAARGEIEESGTSNSSILNAEGCNSSNVGDGDGDDSVSAAGDVDNFHCFNFDILKVGDTGALLSNRNDQDRTSQTQVQTQSEFVTQTFFPMSHGDGRLNLGKQVNSLMLFPNNNEFQEVKLAQVQQQKTIVQVNQVGKKSRRGPRSRSSQYRGVTFYRRTGRWESHIWDCGKQVYLGGFDTAHTAARAYDRAAIKFRGVDADINFNISDYEDDMNQIKNLSKEDFVQILRRHSNGFSRGNSKYRGVTMNKCGKWEAQTGQFHGKKESITNFEANAYEGKTVASPYGNGHNLDLNLGISTPSCASRNQTMDPMQFNHGLHDIRRLHMENRATMELKGLPIISEHGQSWSGMYPTFFPCYKVGPTNTRMIGGPSNWALQLHGQSHTSTTSFTAASSRFPAPATTAAVSATAAAAATNCPDFHYRIIPPPSPPPAPPPTP